MCILQQVRNFFDVRVLFSTDIYALFGVNEFGVAVVGGKSVCLAVNESAFVNGAVGTDRGIDGACHLYGSDFDVPFVNHACLDVGGQQSGGFLFEDRTISFDAAGRGVFVGGILGVGTEIIFRIGLQVGQLDGVLVIFRDFFAGDRDECLGVAFLIADTALYQDLVPVIFHVELETGISLADGIGYQFTQLRAGH